MTLVGAALLIFCRTHDSACVETVTRNVDMIADLAGAYGVDPVLGVAVCAQESRLGTVRAQSLCGTYRARDDETSATVAMDALSAHRRVCRAWDAGLRSYHYNGRCERDDPDEYVRSVRSIERRLRCAMRTGRRC